MSAAPAPKTLVPLIAPLIALFAMVVPLVAINVRVEPPGGDRVGVGPLRPVRIAQWLDSLESFAFFLMVLTIVAVAVLAAVRKQANPRIAWMSLVQAAVVFFLAFPTMFFSRASSLFGASYVESSYNANGTRGAHVYSTGFMECEYSVYESVGWSVRMERVHVLRGCSKPEISWDDDGKIVVKER